MRHSGSRASWPKTHRSAALALAVSAAAADDRVGLHRTVAAKVNGPRGSASNRSSTFRQVAALTWTRPAMPCDSSLLAMFTVSPQMSNANLRWPITPPMTGPECTPTRSRSSAIRSPSCVATSIIASPRSTTRGAWSSSGSDSPPAAMYASPMVLIFSRPRAATSSSKPLEEPAEHPNHFVCWQTRGQWREPNDVSEEHGDVRILIGDRPLTGEESAKRSMTGRTLSNSASALCLSSLNASACRVMTMSW